MLEKGEKKVVQLLYDALCDFINHILFVYFLCEFTHVQAWHDILSRVDCLFLPYGF